MTGKYILFVDKKGNSIKTKVEFLRLHKINNYLLDKLKGNRKEGVFTLKGVKWSFSTIYGNPEIREYIPYSKQNFINDELNNSNVQTKLVPDTKFVRYQKEDKKSVLDLVLETCKKGNLIMTYSYLHFCNKYPENVCLLDN